MTAVVFTDLDGTLVHSRRDLAGLDPDSLTSLESVSGRPGAFVTRRSLDLLSQLSGHAVVVPTTTRTLRQFTRMRWPGPARAVIASNGYRVVVDGVVDLNWSQRCRDLFDGAALPDMLRQVVPVAQKFGARIRVRDDVFISLIGGDQTMMDCELGDLADLGWVSYGGDRAMQIVPQTISKESAAGHVASRLGADHTFACGNEPIDLGLLQWANWSVLRSGPTPVPVGSVVVHERGPQGAEQLIEAVLDKLLRS